MTHPPSNPGFRPEGPLTDALNNPWPALIAFGVVTVIAVTVGLILRRRMTATLWEALAPVAFVAAVLATIGTFGIQAAIGFHNYDLADTRWKQDMVDYLADTYGVDIATSDVDQLSYGLVVTYKGQPTQIKSAVGVNNTLVIVSGADKPLDPIGQ